MNESEFEDLPIPEKCPYCLERQIPKECFSKPYPDSAENLINIYDVDDLPDIFRVFQCLKCNKFFMQVYTIGTNNEGYLSYIPTEYELALDNIDIEINQSIKDLSPDFVEIYSEAYQAERYGLKRICGVGYRKAIEFLIKDYAIDNNPIDTPKISEMALGAVINEYLSDIPKLKNMAKVAAWIGNDETHYLKQHPSKDISDMKQFTKVTVMFIEAEISAQETLVEAKNPTFAGIKEDAVSDNDLPF
ncbi:DUF4145 domain-containing protein [Lactobacillus sp. ESL0679]|uniref:DUF4145 domain-containing protein n=1 Tax=Lactobacillus sp. ESL0679 TaxID=2983209 RepID=UPI0023F70C6B|nr:DUF4145 domain-containing protein [Lactobacillus sp. ESL0679]MDF7683373.1 DUF4145 domain-containing protein [Lactobacillus sp. ESL0679]